ncbi:aminoglycoside phosphotransferase family protein [Streptomyces monashensis]|uniref:aminoglycoside phosphotransferase family protein n=1 Tax=Streptomyces monashensis TaxID=1678012 RepID=UPI000AC3EB23|nr:aminoglycoside phosphotransferase family protein [Streptomyces monashensis]
MDASPGPRAAAGEAGTDSVVQELLFRALATPPARSGHHHDDHVLPLTEPAARLLGRAPGTPVTVRVRRAGAPAVVIRTWPSEPEILRAVGAVLPQVPEVLLKGVDFTVLSHVEGTRPVLPSATDVAGLLAAVVQVRGSALPRLPAGRPGNHTDSQGFLRALAHQAEQQIRRPNWRRHGGLFVALGVPEDALLRFAEQVPAMTRRPYGLLHGDLHGGTLLVPASGAVPLTCVDWELAGYGDPLYDLAVHLVRMRYPEQRRREVVEAWEAAVRRVRPGAVAGLGKDLRHYVAFEYAQSLYAAVIRAARSLEDSFDRGRLETATADVHTALRRGAAALRLGRVPERAEIERVLFRRGVSSRLPPAPPVTVSSPGAGGPGGAETPSAGAGGARPGGSSSAGAGGVRPGGFVSAGGGGGRVGGVGWIPDRRVPEHPGFPHSAVLDALALEGAAPAGRVFKGAAHLNTVLRVPGTGFPVVVRREVTVVLRREPSFLSEHAVLAAIERSGAAVAAPRVLALGESHATDPAHRYRGDRFAVHTYEGGRDLGRRPEHPVHGLRPHEADCLVDQLAELTTVDYTEVDPVAGRSGFCDGRRSGFYDWLSGQLVALVAALPKESQQAARFLGLPDAPRLREILARHRVTGRDSALLHGDLNPWNLVRRDDGPALTLIDWELAVVGDPLYELVRHMHLTPTRPEIRDRMFRRWDDRLAPRFTKNWQEDWRVYRWIELVRSAYVDLDRLVTGTGLDAPNVRRALDSYGMTLAAATASLGLSPRRQAGPRLPPALARPTRPGGPGGPA